MRYLLCKNGLFARTAGIGLILCGLLSPAWAAREFVCRRPPLEKRTFVSEAVEETIRQVKASVRDPKLAWMFENCYPNTLDTTVDFEIVNGRPDTFIITGDIDTIEVYFGIKEGKGSYEDKFRFCAAELKKKLPAMKALSMSFRGTDQYNQPTYSGALLLDNEYYFSPAYSLPQTIDRIGSGDAFEGGLLYGLINQLPPQDIINFAIACGAIKHSMEGDFCIISKEEAEQFVKNGAVNRVIR